jgi:hypothetical protein
VKTFLTDPFIRSGNPGYQVGLPVLVAEGIQTLNQAKKVNKQGFKFFSSDFNGQCFQRNDKAMLGYETTEFNFGSNIQISCGIELSSSELASYCSSVTT